MIIFCLDKLGNQNPIKLELLAKILLRYYQGSYTFSPMNFYDFKLNFRVQKCCEISQKEKVRM